jgi:hypothetical protein
VSLIGRQMVCRQPWERWFWKMANGGYAQYQRARTNPSQADLLSHLTVLPSGEDLKASLQFSEDDLQSLAQMEFAIPHL